MPKMTAHITVSEALNGLEGLAYLLSAESFKELDDDESFDVEAIVSVDACIDVAENEGWIDGDAALDGLDLDVRDLTDGLRYLLEGERVVAAALLSRAFAAWPDAARAAEEYILGRTVRDRRQGALALAA